MGEIWGRYKAPLTNELDVLATAAELLEGIAELVAWLGLRPRLGLGSG